MPTYTSGKAKSSDLSVNPVRKQLVAAPYNDCFTVSLPASPALVPCVGLWITMSLLHLSSVARKSCLLSQGMGSPFLHIQVFQQTQPVRLNPPAKYVAAVLSSQLIQISIGLCYLVTGLIAGEERRGFSCKYLLFWIMQGKLCLFLL